MKLKFVKESGSLVQSTNEKEKATILGIIPRYAALPLLIVVAWNMCVYFGNRIFSSNLYHYDFTTSLDEKIPLIPWTIVIYLGCYPFLDHQLHPKLSRQ